MVIALAVRIYQNTKRNDVRVRVLADPTLAESSSHVMALNTATVLVGHRYSAFVLQRTANGKRSQKLRGTLSKRSTSGVMALNTDRRVSWDPGVPPHSENNRRGPQKIRGALSSIGSTFLRTSLQER